MITEQPWPLAIAAALVLGLGVRPASGAEPPAEPPTAAQAAHQVLYPAGLRARLLRDEPSPVRGLDATVFTELSPVSVSEPGVRLPEDQRMEEASPPHLN